MQNIVQIIASSSRNVGDVIFENGFEFDFYIEGETYYLNTTEQVEEIEKDGINYISEAVFLDIRQLTAIVNKPIAQFLYKLNAYDSIQIIDNGVTYNVINIVNIDGEVQPETETTKIAIDFSIKQTISSIVDYVVVP